MNAKQFVKQMKEDNQALFTASEMQVEAYFNSKPTQEQLVEHFVGRMVNERMNMRVNSGNYRQPQKHKMLGNLKT